MDEGREPEGLALAAEAAAERERPFASAAAIPQARVVVAAELDWVDLVQAEDREGVLRPQSATRTWRVNEHTSAHVVIDP